MSVADWICLAFDAEAHPCAGSLDHEDGRHYVCIYKNWVEFGEPGGQVGTMEQGKARIRGFDVVIDRAGGDSPVFLIASTLDADGQWRWMAGAGCHADVDLGEAKARFLDWLRRQADEWMFAGRDQRDWVARCIEQGGVFVGQGSVVPPVFGRTAP